MSAELPEGWARVCLGELINGFEAGRNLRAHGRPAENGEYGVLKISAVTWGAFRPSENKALLPGDEPRQHEQVCAGDLLISRANTSDLVEAVVLVEKDYSHLMLPDKILRIVPRARVVDPRYLLYALRSQEVREHFSSNATGTSDSMRNLAQPKMAVAPIKLAPLAEQRRIAAKVEALLAQVNAAREWIAKVPLTLKRFRRSVLAKAFRGELVPTDVELAATEGRACEPVEQLLRSIGKMPSGTERESTALPKGWVEIPFSKLIKELRNGISIKPAVEPPGVPILRISVVRPGDVVLEDHRFLTNADELVETYRLRDRDLLFTRYNGSLEFLGVCGMVRDLGSRLFLYPDKLMRVRLEESLALPEYLELFFQSRRARDAILAIAKSSAGQQGISGGDLKEQIVALAPLAEQRRIIAKVRELFAIADKAEQRAALALARAERIPQLILAQAFSGKLVPTDAELVRAEGRSFESAEQLLARGKGELERNPGASKRRGRRLNEAQ